MRSGGAWHCREADRGMVVHSVSVAGSYTRPLCGNQTLARAARAVNIDRSSPLPQTRSLHQWPCQSAPAQSDQRQADHGARPDSGAAWRCSRRCFPRPLAADRSAFLRARHARTRTLSRPQGSMSPRRRTAPASSAVARLRCAGSCFAAMDIRRIENGRRGGALKRRDAWTPCAGQLVQLVGGLVMRPIPSSPSSAPASELPSQPRPLSWPRAVSATPPCS